MALSDDVQQLASIVWALHRETGVFSRVAGSPRAVGRVAKNTGCTVDQLRAFMDGEVPPTTGQGLAAMTAMHAGMPAAVRKAG